MILRENKSLILNIAFDQTIALEIAHKWFQIYAEASSISTEVVEMYTITYNC